MNTKVCEKWDSGTIKESFNSKFALKFHKNRHFNLNMFLVYSEYSYKNTLLG